MWDESGTPPLVGSLLATYQTSVQKLDPFD